MVPTPALVERLAGRWLCRGCQASYHETFSPPSQPGECDVCGGELYQRTDDTREVVANRVEVYLRDTLPVVERYARQGILQRVDGDQAIEAVQAAMLQAIGAAIPA